MFLVRLRILICALSVVQCVYSQNDSIYGLRTNSFYFEAELLKINPIDGGYRLLSNAPLNFSPTEKSHAFIDSQNGLYVIPVKIGGEGMDSINLADQIILYSIDIQTGDSANAVSLPERAVSVEFHCEHQRFYGIKTNPAGTEVDFFSINHLTGVIDIISSSPIPAVPYMLQGSTPQYPVLDPINNLFYFYGVDNLFNVTLYSIDIITGLLNSSIIVTNLDEVHQLVFNPLDDLMYALLVNYSPNERSLVVVDPNDLSWSQVSALPSNIWYNLITVPIISKFHRSYIFTGIDSTLLQYSLFNYNINSGILSTSQIPTNDSLEFLAAWNDCVPNNIYESPIRSKIDVYPNPCSRNVTITHENWKEFQVQIFNNLGQLVINEKSFLNTINIDVSSLNHGYYIVHLKNDISTDVISLIVE